MRKILCTILSIFTVFSFMFNTVLPIYAEEEPHDEMIEPYYSTIKVPVDYTYSYPESGKTGTFYVKIQLKGYFTTYNNLVDAYSISATVGVDDNGLSTGSPQNYVKINNYSYNSRISGGSLYTDVKVNMTEYSGSSVVRTFTKTYTIKVSG